MGSARQRDGAGAASHRLIAGFLASHLLAVVAEWACFVGVVVYAFERGGSSAAGLASLVTLGPSVLLTSTTARWAERHRPGRVRWAGLVVQALGYGLTAAAMMADAPVALATAGAAVALTAVTTLRPAGAVLLPALVRDSASLITTNVRTGYCDSSSALAGPVVATVALGIGGPSAVLVGCAGLAAIAAVAATVTLTADPPAPPAGSLPVRARKPLGARLLQPFDDVRKVSRRPAAFGVMAAATVQSLMVGGFDVALVVIAGEELDLGDTGAGVLTTLFGIGALLTVTVSGRIVRRPRLGPLIAATMGLMAVAPAVFGVWMAVPVAIVVLPLCGMSRTLMDQMSRVLLQRSAPPSELASVFGALETSNGTGMLAGSVLAQVAIAVGGPSAALGCISLAYLVTLVAVARRLRAADDGADVPVVEMSLLGRIPLFAAMPSPTLEAVARAAVSSAVSDGQVIVRQGESGDAYYAVVEGSFDVDVSGRTVRTLVRGEGFGEVALLAGSPRTATVTAAGHGSLLAIDRTAFLTAVTGHDTSYQAAWGGLHHLEFDGERPVGPS